MIKPPTIMASLRGSKTFRFKVISSALSETILTQANLMDILCMADTAISARRLFAAVRLKKISIWGFTPPGSVATTPTEVAVEYNATGNLGSSTQRFSDISVSPFMPAHVSAAPDKRAVGGMWSEDAGSLDVALLTAPLGSIIDFDIEYVFRNGETPYLVRAIAGATVGQVGVLDIYAGILRSVGYLHLN